MSNIHEVCILGAGVVGQVLAVALAQSHRRVALVGSAQQSNAQPDVRAYSLNLSSRQLLEQWGLWPGDSAVTPVECIQVWGDDASNILFPGETQSPLSWIVDVPALEHALHAHVASSAQIDRVDQPVPAQLTIVCEGRFSATRSQLGVSRVRRPYGQVALATRVRAEHPHGAQASQWFNHTGPHSPHILALLPMGGVAGHDLAVVWSLPSALSQELKNMPDPSFEEALQDASHHLFGRLRLTSARTSWPLEWGQADHWCGRDAKGQTWVLAGDAARNIHPLAGLGLNLGLGDVRGLLSHLPQLHGEHHWRPLNDLRLLRAYERQRKAESAPTTWVVDGLQGLFMHPHPAAQTLRNSGLTAANQWVGLKKWIVDRATSPL